MTERFSEDICGGGRQLRDLLLTEKRSCEPPSKMWVASEIITRCSLGARTFERQISFLMRLVWPKAGNVKYQEIVV